jgi:anaerobic glycerol-3-phosphate dehydrogenase
VQLFLNFATPQQPPAHPHSRLDPEQRAELVQALARIISKAAGADAPAPEERPHD